MKSINISKFQITENSRPFIVAEISSNHKSSLSHTIKLIKKLKEAGADAVKIQTYDETSMTLDSQKKEFLIKDGLWKNYNLYSLYKKAKTPYDWHKKIFDYARRINLIVFSTPYDEKSLKFLSKFNPPVYKVASFELIDLPLIERMARKKKPIILSTGMASLKEISEALSVIKKTKNYKTILLHCISNYPSNHKDYNLKMMLELKRKFNVNIGLSDHTRGNTVAIAATALGAKVIEKHVKLKGDIISEDSKFSMDHEEFKVFCKKIKSTWETLGDINFDKRPDRLSKKFRRSIYVTRDIEKGERLNLENIKRIRPSEGLHPKYFYKILGKRIKKSIKKGTPLKFSHLAK